MATSNFHTSVRKVTAANPAAVSNVINITSFARRFTRRSGCSTFYNTAEEERANTHMERDFANKSFVITATKDIAEGEELLHVYKSKGWRTCFQELNE